MNTALCVFLWIICISLQGSQPRTQTPTPGTTRNRAGLALTFRTTCLPDGGGGGGHRPPPSPRSPQHVHPVSPVPPQPPPHSFIPYLVWVTCKQRGLSNTPQLLAPGLILFLLIRVILLYFKTDTETLNLFMKMCNLTASIPVGCIAWCENLYYDTHKRLERVVVPCSCAFVPQQVPLGPDCCPPAPPAFVAEPLLIVILVFRGCETLLRNRSVRFPEHVWLSFLEV